MLSKENVRIGIAPIGWTEDDMPEYGAENSFLQTISEIALSGYVGTEIGSKYPRNPEVLKREFGRRGLSAITAWISTYINEKPLWWNEREFVDHMNFLKAIGATMINTSDQSFCIQHRANTYFANKPVLDEKQFEELARGLDHLGRIAADNGMKLIYHHHMTTTVQTTAEIDKLMALTDPRYVWLIFDTGHLTFSGEDPVDILSRHFDRIAHVHLKNVRADALKRCHEKKLSFLMSVLEGAFTVPGDETGCVDFPAVFKILAERDYKGWLVVEAEQDPGKYNPLEYACLARKYVAEQIGF